MPASLPDRFAYLLGALDLLGQRAEVSPRNGSAIAAVRAELLERWRHAPTDEARARLLEIGLAFGDQVRNAAPPAHQQELRAQLRALVNAYGWRSDTRGPSGELVPYLPASFAEAQIRRFGRWTRSWLEREDVPEGARQPQFIQHHFYGALGILGRFEGEAFTPNPESYEPAPPRVATRAPAYFPPESPAGQPHPLVVKGHETYAFLDKLSRLAIHFDVLSGAPTRMDLAVEATTEAAKELPQTLGHVVRKAKKAVGEVVGPGLVFSRDVVTALAVGATSLAVLYVVGNQR